MVCELGRLLGEEYRVLECSFNAFEESHIFQSGNRVLSLGIRRKAGQFARLASYLVAAFRLRQLKKRFAVDVTISNLWQADLVNALSGGPGQLISIAHINIVGNPDNRLLFRFRRLARFVYQRFHIVVAVNSALQQELIEVFDLSVESTTTIPNFLPPAEPDDEAPTRSNRKRIAWCGRLETVKNLESLLPIFRQVKVRVPRAQLLVIGSGSQEARLIASARSGGLTVSTHVNDEEADVIFAGFRRDAVALMKSCDLFVLTARSEGFGLVILEAMSAGLPVLCADCPTGGPHSIMRGAHPYQPGRRIPEQTPYGYLLPIPDASNPEAGQEWEGRMVELLDSEPTRSRMARHSRERVNDFSIDRIKQQWRELLHPAPASLPAVVTQQEPHV